MTSYTKQAADIYFDAQDETYRAVVEYFPEDHSKAPVSVPVSFPGKSTLTFDQIQELAFREAASTLAALG